jgi:SAM-dependent methyltransferase
VSERQLSRLQRDWEDLASVDPLSAILWEPDRNRGGWDAAEFMATGEHEVEQLLSRASALGLPERRNRALDFGCGVGRVTGALSRAFEEAIGIDIAEAMISHARRLNAARDNCTFLHISRPDLSMFGGQTFDLIYSRIVLQHLPDRTMIECYLRELLGLIGERGLLVFQVPHRLPVRQQLRPRRRAYHALRAIGFDANGLYRRLGLNPTGMIDFPESRAIGVIGSAGCLLLAVDAVIVPEGIEDRTYYVTRSPIVADGIEIGG